MQSSDDKVIAKIKKAKRGSLFFTGDFLTLGTSKIIVIGLELLVEKQEITRVVREFGFFIYFKFLITPQKNYYFTLMKPTLF